MKTPASSATRFQVLGATTLMMRSPILPKRAKIGNSGQPSIAIGRKPYSKDSLLCQPLQPTCPSANNFDPFPHLRSWTARKNKSKTGLAATPGFPTFVRTRR